MYLELGVGADILRGIGWLIWLLTAVALGVAFTKPKTKLGKAVAGSLVLAVVASIFLPSAIRQYEHKQRYAKAKALFDERCKAAGEKIYRTVEGVDGVFLIRPRTERLNYGDQYRLDDPYGYAGTGDNYLKLFVRGRPTIPVQIAQPLDPSNVVTYNYVEVFDETSRLYLKYTTNVSKEDSERYARNGGGSVPLIKEEADMRSARYGIDWADISTQQDRDFWIAGSEQRILDLETGEVLAKRIGYMFDPGLGDTSGGRSPWSMARRNACPMLDERIFYFFDRVVKPKNGSDK